MVWILMPMYSTMWVLQTYYIKILPFKIFQQSWYFCENEIKTEHDTNLWIFASMILWFLFIFWPIQIISENLTKSSIPHCTFHFNHIFTSYTILKILLRIKYLYFALSKTCSLLWVCKLWEQIRHYLASIYLFIFSKLKNDQLGMSSLLSHSLWSGLHNLKLQSIQSNLLPQ
jgi:hypothetical protein